jgi:hypothetical protein
LYTAPVGLSLHKSHLQQAFWYSPASSNITRDLSGTI